MNALSQDLSGPDAVDLSGACLAIARQLVAGARLWFAAPRSAGLTGEMVTAWFIDCDAGQVRVLTVWVEDTWLETLRAGAAAGDVLVLVAGSAELENNGLRQRAAAWGVLTVWIGNGPRPAPGEADHVLSAGSEKASFDLESAVAVCELLAELTSAHLQHPEAIEPERPGCEEEVCRTCSDERRLGEVVALGADGLAQVRTPAGLETVDTTLIDDACPGDLVLIHAGTALSLIAKEAR